VERSINRRLLLSFPVTFDSYGGVDLSNIFSSLSLALKSFQANKIAIDTIGHNIANVNTPGYSRQRVELSTSVPERTVGSLVGRGVQVEAISQIRSEFYEKDIQEKLKRYGFSSAELSAFQQIETVINNDPTTGLSLYVTKFFNYFEDLAISPENYPTRQSVYYAAQDLVNNIKEIRGSLDKQRGNLDIAIEEKIVGINTRLGEIADLNKKIIEAEVSANANDFRDQRTNLLQELSQEIDVSYFIEENGSMTIMKGGVSLVTRGHYNTLEGVPNTDNNGYLDVYVNLPGGMQENITDKIKYGELGAYLDVRDNHIINFIDDIDKLASIIIKEVNKVHSSGVGLNNFTVLTGTYSVYDADIALNDSQNIKERYLPFSPQDGSFKVTVIDSSGEKTVTTIDVLATESLSDLVSKIGAIDNVTASINTNNQVEISSDSGYEFALSEDSSYVLAALGLNTFFDGYSGKDISVNSVIAGDVSMIAASSTGAPGDGDNALKLAGLRDEKLMDGNTTFNEFYSLLVSTIGNNTSVTETGLKAAETSLEAIRNLRDSVSGVSIDEELANMMRFQRSYEASAKFLSTINSMIDVLVNRLF